MSVVPPGNDYGTPLSQILSTVLHLVGVSIISFCFARRLPGGSSPTYKGWLTLSLPRIAVLGVFIDSWIFLFGAGILVNGVGTQMNLKACKSAIYLCVVFYVSSKVFVYFFLAEKVYVVWGASSQSSRWQSRPYKFCIVLIALYAVVIGSMFAGRLAIYRTDRACYVGLTHWAGIPLLAYDLAINIIMTALFVVPIVRENLANPALRSVAIRTSLAAGVSLSTSTVNVLVLLMMKGMERAWICLACCTADVVINALAIYWVTASPDKPPKSSKPNVVSFTPVTMDFARFPHSMFTDGGNDPTVSIVGDSGATKALPSTTACICTECFSATQSMERDRLAESTKTWPFGQPETPRRSNSRHSYPHRTSLALSPLTPSFGLNDPSHMTAVPLLPLPQLSPTSPSIPSRPPPLPSRIPSPPAYPTVQRPSSQSRRNSTEDLEDSRPRRTSSEGDR